MGYGSDISFKKLNTKKYINIRLKMSTYIYAQNKGKRLHIKGINNIIERLLQISGMPISNDQLKVKNRTKAQAALDILFKLPILFIILVIAFFVLNTFFNVFPIPSNPLASIAYTNLSGGLTGGKNIADTAIIFIVIIIVFVDLFNSYQDPQIWRGFRNVVLFLILGYLSLVSNVWVNSINSALAANNIFPQFYGLLTSNYLLALLFFGLIIDIVINIRGNKNNNQRVNYNVN